MNKTLTQLQEAAIEEILAVRENGKRASGFGLTFLNRSARGLRGVRRHYEAQAAKLGYTAEQIGAQWNDVKDMAKLNAICE